MVDRKNGKLVFISSILALMWHSEKAIAAEQLNSFSFPEYSGKNIYVGLSYSPAWHHIGNFTIGASDGSTAARYPLLPREKTNLTSSFNWQVQDPRIQFNRKAELGLEGSVGYRKNAARVEIELGYEKFETKGIGPGGKLARTETIHLLAKELAHDVVSGKTERLAHALAATAPQDIVAFAKAVGNQAKDIDQKVCRKRVAVDDVRPNSPLRSDIPQGTTVEQIPAPVLWSCIDYADFIPPKNREPTNPKNAEIPEKDGLSLRFVEVGGHNTKKEDKKGECKEHTENVSYGSSVLDVQCGQSRAMVIISSGGANTGSDIASRQPHRWWTGKQTNRGWPGTAEGKINTAQGMAGDLVSNLDSAEKETVAGILTKTVSGAEVVEIRSVSTTSVILNACYDLGHAALVPFACLGVGANFVSVTDDHVAAKLSYKLKAGLSCYVTPRVTAFVSGFYHKVLGEGEYDNIPVEHLKDDQSPGGRSQDYALARFRMSYTGAELGVRFAF